MGDVRLNLLEGQGTEQGAAVETLAHHDHTPQALREGAGRSSA
jgi:hypothetical protein